MPLIDHIIPESNLEKIRKQIFVVLDREFQNQSYGYNNTTCKGVTFWRERTQEIDKTESAIIIISTLKGDYDNESMGSSHGTYTYLLDIIANAANTPLERGDTTAGYRVQQLIRNIRYILSHQNYITLDLLPGIIENTEVQKFQIYQKERIGDAVNNAIGQVVFTVRCEETTLANGGRLFAIGDTEVKVEQTDLGYQYQLVA